jgi:hypothetical protein
MDGVLPDEFPFNKRKTAPAEIAPAVIVEVPVVPAAVAAAAAPQPVEPPPAPAPNVEHVEAETLVEISAGPRVLYRGRERRRSPRQALRAKATYRDDTKPAAGGAVQVVNISMFGVRLWSPRPVAVNDRATVRMELGPVKWSSRVRVVTCETLEDDGYVLGCDFVANELPKRRVDAA